MTADMKNNIMLKQEGEGIILYKHLVSTKCESLLNIDSDYSSNESSLIGKDNWVDTEQRDSKQVYDENYSTRLKSSIYQSEPFLQKDEGTLSTLYYTYQHQKCFLVFLN